MASASIPAEPGEIVIGKYQVERVIGTGGVGVVVAARHLTLGQTVALKFLLPGASHDKADVRRFEREAQSAVQLKDEHVCHVFDVGELDDGSPFIVLEYLEGRDLAHLVRNTGPLPIVEAVGYILQVCEAVAEAHSLGMVHRDLKPSNFFLTHRRDGMPLVKVLDFGIAKYKIELEQHDVSLTQTRALLGSPVYMSPEQVRSARSVDHRSDIWSLGVSLFELLTDTVPFGGETVTGVAAAVSTDPVPPIARYRPDVPVGLASVIERCLAKRPEDRFQSIAELAAALVPFGPAEGNYSLYRISGTLRVVPAGAGQSLRDSTNAGLARSTEQNTQVSTTHPVSASTPSAAAPMRKRAYVAGTALAGLGLIIYFVQGQAPSSRAVPAQVSGPLSAQVQPARPDVARVVEASGSGAPQQPPSEPLAPQPEIRIATSAEPVASALVPAKKPKLTMPSPAPASTHRDRAMPNKNLPLAVDKTKNPKQSSVGGTIDDTVDTRH